MLPQDPAILRPQRVPSLLEGDESGIEGVALRTGHDLAAPAPVERAEEVHGVCGLERFEIRPDGQTAQLGLPGHAADVELSAARAQEEPEQRQESLAVPDIEQLQDVPGVEAVDPLAEGRGAFLVPQQRLRQPAVQQAAVEIADPEGFRALFPEHRTEMDRLLAPSQGVAELAGGGRCERPGRQNPKARVPVGGDLQQQARVRQAVDLVEDDGGAGRLAAEEQLRIRQCLRGAGKLTVQVLRIGQHPH